MKRFHFRLEKLLQLRRHREREWELKLAKAGGQVVQLEGQVSALQNEVRASRKRERAGVGPLDMSSLASLEWYWRRLENDTATARQSLQRSRAHLEEVRRSFADVSKERKVLDKLREKREADYYRNQSREELRALDESSAGATVRKAIREG
jgi:flagellar FliJ protein